jgi:zinc protease
VTLVAALAVSLGAPPSNAAPAAPAAKPGKPAKGKAAITVELPIVEFTSSNGMRVIVLEDHSTPTFAMHIVYDVGSADEVTGRSGFAHLFEHMMFKGSKNVPDGGHFKFIQNVGGDMNASTNYDYTNYFNILPSNYLDMAMWLESDRLRSLEVTDENFENQRAAVKEEKGLRVDNAPYIGAFQGFLSEVWSGTGYGHSPIGSMEDLDAAQTADVQAFFNQYYSPANAVMTVVGDVTVDEVKAKVEQYFGDIPAGQRKPATGAYAVKADAPVEKRVEDPIATTPAYVIGWRTVEEGHPDAPAIELLGNALMRGESSRISKILKDEKKLIVGGQFFPFTNQKAGMALTLMIPNEGSSIDAIKAIVKEEVAKVRAKGLTPTEFSKVKNQKLMDTVESLATNFGRATLIGMGALFHNDPKWPLTMLERYQAVTPADVKRVANTYLNDNWVVLEIAPKQGGGMPGMGM